MKRAIKQWFRFVVGSSLLLGACAQVHDVAGAESGLADGGEVCRPLADPTDFACMLTLGDLGPGQLMIAYESREEHTAYVRGAWFATLTPTAQGAEFVAVGVRGTCDLGDTPRVCFTRD